LIEILYTVFQQVADGNSETIAHYRNSRRYRELSAVEAVVHHASSNVPDTALTTASQKAKSRRVVTLLML